MAKLYIERSAKNDSRLKRRTINSRVKGKNFELLIVKKFWRWFPMAKRGQQSRGGEENPDVLLSETRPPYFIECKKYGSNITRGMLRDWKKKVDQDRDRFCRARKYKPMPAIIIYREDYGKIMVLLDTNCNVPWPVFRDSMDKKYNTLNSEDEHRL